MPTPNKVAKKILPGAHTVSNLLVAYLSSALCHGLVWLIAAVILSYLIYIRVWQPLQQQVILPAEVSQLNMEILKDINAARLERSQHQPQDFSASSSILMPGTLSIDSSGTSH